MVEENKINDVNAEVESKKVVTGKVSAKNNDVVKVESDNTNVKTDDLKSEIVKEKSDSKNNKKKVKKKELPKKDVAIANGYSLKISPKQSVYVCRIIRRKSPENAIKRLQAVIDEKRPVPMAGLEVGHRKGKGLAGGKFPKNACREIIEIIKQVSANSVVARIDNPIITIAKSDRASAPYRRSGQKAKRTHIHIEVREKGAKA